MPRFAIFSDVHGNAEALEAFLARTQSQKVDAYLCCGDLVGYGADPQRCLEEVKALCGSPLLSEPAVVLGNHDEAVATGDVSRMNARAAEAVLWTRRQLSEAQLDYLGALPLTFTQGEDLLLVHGTPSSPGAWNYVLDLADIGLAADHFSQALCCIGHSHVPFFAELRAGGEPVVLRRERVSMRRDARYLVNVGSIGQPRDGDPRGCYVLYDSDENTLERFRFEYPVEQAQEKILRAGLPSILAQRLAVGF